MEVSLKTTTRATNPYGRDLMKSIIYFLRLNKISLISSLKSVITTAITEMKLLNESIMDSFIVSSSHAPNQIAKKKAQPQKEAELLAYYKGSLNLFIIHLVKMDKQL